MGHGLVSVPPECVGVYAKLRGVVRASQRGAIFAALLLYVPHNLVEDRQGGWANGAYLVMYDGVGYLWQQVLARLL